MSTYLVERWSGRSGDKAAVRFIGSRDLAEAKYEKLAEAMRQGEVRLIGPDRSVIKRRTAYRNRTRW